jgi:hypothetical protein
MKPRIELTFMFMLLAGISICAASATTLAQSASVNLWAATGLYIGPVLVSMAPTFRVRKQVDQLRQRIAELEDSNGTA